MQCFNQYRYPVRPGSGMGLHAVVFLLMCVRAYACSVVLTFPWRRCVKIAGCRRTHSGKMQHRSDENSNANILETQPSCMPMAMSAAGVDVDLTGTDVAACQKQNSCDSLPVVHADSGCRQELQCLPEPSGMRDAASVAESPSTCLTADVEQLLDMSLTESISSPLLTPVSYRGRSIEADVSLQKSRGDERAVNTIVARRARAADPDPRTEPSNPRVIPVADVCSDISHPTPIAALQTGRSTQGASDTSRHHSRIPSSINRPKSDSQESHSKVPCVKHDFSFSEDVPHEVATPKGFGPHQMWDMGDFAFDVPQLQLSQAAAIDTSLKEDMSPEESMKGTHADTVKETGASSTPLALAISSLTPIANVDTLASSPHCTLAAEKNQPDRQIQGLSRPPARPGFRNHARSGTRIPSCRRKSCNQASARDSGDQSTRPPLSTAEHTSLSSSSGTPNKHVRLILGTGEATCVSTPRPSADPELVQAKADEVLSIGTPPYDKLMQFLRNPNPGGDPASALAQESRLQDTAVSPVMLPEKLRSFGAMTSVGQAESKPFRQLLQNIEANQYRSPAVNLAAFAGIAHSDISTQPERSSPMMTQSEMGENSTNKGGYIESDTQEDIVGHMFVDQLLADDVCWSRVSAGDPRDGAVSECSVGTSEITSVMNQVGNVESPINLCRLASKFGVVASKEPDPAVAVTIAGPEDGDCQLKVLLNVRDEVQPLSSESVASELLSQQSAELGRVVIDDCPLLQQAPVAGIHDSAAISSTVNIAQRTACSQQDATEVSSCVNSGIRNSAASVEGGDSPMHSVSIADVHDVVSPPQLCTTDGDASPSQLQADSARQNCLHSPIKSFSPDQAGAL